jgi:hypothetical protein
MIERKNSYHILQLIYNELVYLMVYQQSTCILEPLSVEEVLKQSKKGWDVKFDALPMEKM